MVLWFYASVYDKLGSGPLWQETIGIQRDGCQKLWWANLLYVNNYVQEPGTYVCLLGYTVFRETFCLIFFFVKEIVIKLVLCRTVLVHAAVVVSLRRLPAVCVGRGRFATAFTQAPSYRTGGDRGVGTTVRGLCSRHDRCQAPFAVFKGEQSVSA